VTLPTVVLAQVWRGNSPIVARIQQACRLELLDPTRARRVGELLAKSRTADVVDAIVVLGALDRGDAILTSDRDDIERLIHASGSKLTVFDV
jgi:hypothetical protein